MKHRNKSRVRRKLKVTTIIWTVFILTGGAYLLSRIGLNSYNIQLSAQNQQLSADIQNTLSEIDDLQTEIGELQEKARVLGMLDNQVSDNKDNIYVIDNNQ